MKNYLEIESIEALEVLDSRGNPTVQVTVELIDGSVGVAMVPFQELLWFHQEHQQEALKR